MIDNSSIAIKARAYAVTRLKTDSADRCFVNVSIGDFLHINSIAVMPNPKDNNKMWVMMPKNPQNRGKSNIEFPDLDTNPLLQAIQNAAISAYSVRANREYGETYHIEVDKLCNYIPQRRIKDGLVDTSEIDYGNDDTEINWEDVPF
ncbi:MAG: hypothetical protein Q4C24_00500 [Candidatus Saccharibacteria bacterium]|nr:hypothetical protein [Candidatus Saccharibacteria bacterium]